jgi:guanylate kinase
LSIARQEEEALPEFDYRVVNADLETAVQELRAILTAERLKVARVLGRSAS